MRCHTGWFPSQKTVLAAAVAAVAMGSIPSFAQSENKDALHLEEVVVTGRAGAGDTTKMDISHSVTTKSADDIENQAPLSATDFLKAVPGLWVEASGGEANGNVRARGIPVDGFGSVALYEDNLPLQHDSGLSWLNADQVFRLDDTVELVEAVRGGPSSIFASNAPGGIINVITKKGSDTPEGSIKLTVGDYGLRRGDFFYGGPINDDWKIALGGYYRTDDSIREPGFTANDGGQFRVTLSREMDKGRLDISYRHLNDRNFFALPLPLTNDGSGDPAGIPGFDPNTGTTLSPQVQNFTLKLPDGNRIEDLSDGTHVQLSQFTVNFEYELNDDWTLINRTRVRDSDISRNSAFPNTPNAAASSLDAYRNNALAAFSDAVDIRAQYVTSGDVVPANSNGNGLLMTHNFTSVKTPLREFINDFQLGTSIDVGEQTHNLTFGVYFANYDREFQRHAATYLSDVKSQPALVDVLAIDATGNVVGSVTDNGVLRYGSRYQQADDEGRASAFYIADEWVLNDELRIDLGIRWEEIDVRGVAERASNFDLGDSSTLADDNVSAGNGEFVPFDRSFNDISWTVGSNYALNEDSALFARYTKAFRLPNSADFRLNPNRDIQAQDITQLETGYKLLSEELSLFATVFYSEFDNVEFTNTIFDSATNSTSTQREFAKTETLGLELETVWSPTELFDIAATITWQDAEFKDFEFNQIDEQNNVTQVSFTGNRPIRIPDFAMRLRPTLNLLDDQLRLYLEYEYNSDRYVDAANSRILPEYSVWNIGASYQLDDNLRLIFSGKNLDNEIGLTEGNPRAGQFTSTDTGSVYLARPIFGRAFTLSVKYEF